MTATRRSPHTAGPGTEGRPDRAAIFRVKGKRARLLQTHAARPFESEASVAHLEGTVYDPGATKAGGASVVETDPRGHQLDQWTALSGTVNNTVGGPTPWGTWLTGEEFCARAGDTWTSRDGHSGTYAKNHGYVFEVFNAAAADQNPRPIKAFGRFAHAATAVEPSRRRVYMTEAAGDPSGLFYRWTAPYSSVLGRGIGSMLNPYAGTLEAMKVIMDDGSVLFDLAAVTSAGMGRPFRVEWTAVPDREALNVPIRDQLATGTHVTSSANLTNCWSDGQRGVSFVSERADAAQSPYECASHNGQIWLYDFGDQTLTLTTYFPVV
ncbi:MAG: twin-arginine translocation pathway signal [Pseudonocardiales bacterium]|nr:twin-arginine translocation pathway signal [Pseudonocardiales bacterium]